MKLKLKVSKTLKRDLKIKATSLNIERKEYVFNELMNYINTKNDLWKDKIDGYAEFVENRNAKLVELKISLEENDEMSSIDKRTILINYYIENKMYRDIISKNRKLENIIIDLSEEDYNKAALISEYNGKTIESNTIDFLQRLINDK